MNNISDQLRQRIIRHLDNQDRRDIIIKWASAKSREKGLQRLQNALSSKELGLANGGYDYKKPLHKRLHVTISSLRGARNPHLLRVNSGFCAPCASNLTRSAVCAKVSISIQTKNLFMPYAGL